MELDIEDIKVGSSASPVLNLVKRAGALSGILRVLGRCHFFDLSCPIDNCGLKSLKKILIPSSRLDITQILVWNI